jgi:hypothetical protein
VELAGSLFNDGAWITLGSCLLGLALLLHGLYLRKAE